MKLNYFCPQINAQAMQSALSPDTQTWVTLGRQMGTILAAIGADAKNSLTITAYGKRPCSLALLNAKFI